MFVAHKLELGVGFRAAQARLVKLACGEDLCDASRDAYDGELARMVTRLGPFGDLGGVSKLVRVRFLDPVYRDDAMRLALRWEITGMTGRLFPVLDADITLTPNGEHATRLAMAGSYRPPLGRVGAALDRMILNQVATGTTRALMQRLADALANPGPSAEHPTRPPGGRRVVTEADTST
jgi:hypothetical protein